MSGLKEFKECTMDICWMNAYEPPVIKLDPSLAPLPLATKHSCFLSLAHAILSYTNLPLRTNLTTPHPLSVSDDLSLTSYHIYILHKTNDLLMRPLLLYPLIASYIKNLFSPTRYGSLWIHTINLSCIFQYLYNTEHIAGSQEILTCRLGKMKSGTNFIRREINSPSLGENTLFLVCDLRAVQYICTLICSKCVLKLRI